MRWLIRWNPAHFARIQNARSDNGYRFEFAEEFDEERGSLGYARS
jgi:hypothetical protein